MWLALAIGGIGSIVNIASVQLSLSKLKDDLDSSFDDINACISDELAHGDSELLIDIVDKNSGGLNIALILMLAVVLLYTLLPCITYACFLECRLAVKKYRNSGKEKEEYIKDMQLKHFGDQ